MQTRTHKESSSVSPTSTHNKSKGSDGERSFSVQRQPEMNSSPEQEKPSYSRNAADSLVANVMRSMKEGKDSDEMSLRAGVQTKLTVGAVGDKYEQEADQVAAQVMRMPVAPDNSPQVQHFGEEENSVQMWSLAQSITPVVQRQVDEQVQMRSLVQRAFQSGGNQASGDLESSLNAFKGGGSALAPEVRAFMEPRFGVDFSSVRVHTGGEAVQMNRELGAQAFTHGSDVYFGAGKSPGNNELTAHELTHVVQQSGTQLQTKQVQQSPTQRTEEDKIQRQSPLDWLTDRVGDALNSRDDEQRLDAEEDLTDFMSEEYEVTNHHPTTGRGLFDATYQPRTGAMTVSVKICFKFASGDRTNAEWITGVGGPAVAATYTDEQFDWQDGEADAWKENAIGDVEAAWSEQYTFHNTRQHWEALPNVNVRVDVVEAPEDEAHYVTTVNKWPKDGGLSAGVVPPGDANQSTAHFEESADNGITNPDSSHRVRTTNTRAAYQIVDTNNPGQILFNVDSAEVSAADQARLQTFGQTLGRPEIPPFPVTLTGHSSSEGDEERNMRLSEDRARAVSNEIVSAGAKTQPTVTARGEEGADTTPQWRRVDITVGRFESDQTTVLHEFGHMFGLGDEYPTADGGSRDVGTEVAHSDLAETLIPGQQPIVAHHDESIMSNGEVIRPHHYVTFLEALGTMTNTTGQWAVGPRSGPRGPGDFPTRGPNDPIPA